VRIQTLSVVAGSEACNARCPFCVSKMTVAHGLGVREPEVNWRNFRKACQLAVKSGVTTAMLTGKGEPTLFPDQITRYLEAMADFGFPLLELQTNGILLVQHRERYAPHLQRWYELGLSTVAVSIMHHDPERNREIYLPHQDHYVDLPALIDLLHGAGLSVRLACIMAGGYVDSVAEVRDLVAFAREHRVEQLSVRPVARPDHSRDAATAAWTAAHQLAPGAERAIAEWVAAEGTKLMTLAHGAVVYDVGGQNLCLTDCLTIQPATEDLRQLIFFPDGHLRYDWQYPGAILM
jgi:molybdenum cofactor biosynthesis enzyme MoaA